MGLNLGTAQIRRVDRLESPERVEYVIDAELMNPARFLTLSTLSAFRAALCDRAKATHAWTRIGWTDTIYGPRLMTVELLCANGQPRVP